MKRRPLHPGALLVIAALTGVAAWILFQAKLTPEEYRERQRALIRPGSYIVDTAVAFEMPRGVPSDPFAFVREAQATQAARMTAAAKTPTR